MGRCGCVCVGESNYSLFAEPTRCADNNRHIGCVSGSQNQEHAAMTRTLKCFDFIACCQ